MRRSSVLPALGAFAALSLISGLAGATIMLPMSLEDLTKESHAVVRGRVLRQNAAWDAAHQRIYTTTELEVLDPIHSKVQLGKTIALRTLGGEADGVGMRVAGTPQFTAGEEVIVFLRPDPVVAATFTVTGMSQGKYHVKREAKGQAIAVPGLEGMAFARKGEDGVLRPETATPPLEMPIEELRKKIVEAAEAGVRSATTPNASTPNAPAPKAPAAPAPVTPLAPK